MNDSGNPLGKEWWKGFDFKNPDYGPVLRMRQERLTRLRQDSGLLAAVWEFYREEHFVEFIRDWGMTRDPRVSADGRSPIFPFIPFPRQEELLRWFHERVKRKERGVVDKTRDCGASWCALAYAIWRFIFLPNNDIGFGSRKEELVDSKNDPKALFPKGREFIRLLPKEFRPTGWDERKHSPYMKFVNPENGSTIIGEAGDNIGRGGRTILYFVDESAFLERPQLVEAALSENTNTQIDISTHNGTGTLFFKKTQSYPKERVFEFDWRDDPRKDEEWYKRKKNDPATDPVIFAQEVDRDPSASVADGFIPVELLEDAMSRPESETIAHGPWIVSVDVAAMGNDQSIVNIRRGSVNYPQIKFRKLEGDQLAAEVGRIVKKLLDKNIAPLGAIIYELEGPGYGFHVAMKSGPWREALRPIHPGRKLQSVEFFNERARFWALAKEWLEEGMKSMAPDRQLKLQASALRYDYKQGPKGEMRLIIEGKKEYRMRMAADPKNKMSGPSPDEADAWAMSFAPVRMAKVLGPADEDDRIEFTEWHPLDSVVGY